MAQMLSKAAHCDTQIYRSICFSMTITCFRPAVLLWSPQNCFASFCFGVKPLLYHRIVGCKPIRLMPNRVKI